MCVLTCALKFLLHSKMSRSNKSAMSTIHRCRDETKRDKRVETKRTKITNSINDLRNDMLEEFGSWVRPEFRTLRNFVDVVSNNTAIFPKNTRASSMIDENADNMLLSNNFVQQLESWSMLKRDDANCDPMLQATGTSTKFRKLALNSCEHTQKQAVLQASDKSKCFITMKIAS